MIKIKSIPKCIIKKWRINRFQFRNIKTNKSTSLRVEHPKHSRNKTIYSHSQANSQSSTLSMFVSIISHNAGRAKQLMIRLTSWFVALFRCSVDKCDVHTLTYTNIQWTPILCNYRSTDQTNIYFTRS